MAQTGRAFTVVFFADVQRELRKRALARGLAVAAAAAADMPAGTPMGDVCLAIVDRHCDVAALRTEFPHALVVSEDVDAGAVDLHIPAGAQDAALDLLLEHALSLTRQRVRFQHDLAAQHGRIELLTEMSQALAGERDAAKLLDRILTEGRRLAHCEGGSLYLIDLDNAVPALTFKLVQNDVVPVTFEERRLNITATSLAGYVALTGDELNIPDAYDIAPERPYRFNAEFDERVGYRSRSLLVLPMRDHRGNVVGVLQFINRRVDGSVVAFDAETVELLRAVGSQAAIAIQKNRLISDIRDLFEQFVHASVKSDRTARPRHQWPFVPGGGDHDRAVRGAATIEHRALQAHRTLR
ncbi:MAG: GAF domain-containing protein [Gammaproteobacteria bacterium]|nr:GAF domain-containing protein [Gammaproteobacteria bacterium]